MTNHRSRPSGADGSATAETAVALPALVVVLGVCVWALAGVGLQLRCAEAARAGARVAARGESTAAVTAAARGSAGRAATVAVQRDADHVRVTVATTLVPRLPLLGRVLPRLTVHGAATAATEPPGATP